MLAPLPIDAMLPALERALAEAHAAVLVAEPGAGKTTRVPLALRAAPWLAGRAILLLEPRRIAARAAATYMARLLGEAVGETVGYRVRFEARVGPATRIEVLTEGLLTRRLQADPALDSAGLVIFDEFHERSLDSDLALALTLDARAALRPDLRVLVMSATLDAARVSAVLGGAPILEAPGRVYPVEIRHRPRRRDERIESGVARVIGEALATEPGSVLAFLPGEAEIRRTAAGLGALPETVEVRPLFGAMPLAEQDQAIAPPAPGRRKVVLATTIAETSLTIEGIRVVVDGGLKRVPRFDPSSGMTRLDTVRVSRASAAQRRGRAGRIAPGVCFRLWAEAEERALAEHDTPEIAQADLAPLALELALWGVRTPDALAFLDPPPRAAFRQAGALLTALAALDGEGALTAHGRAMARLPLHPRLGHMVVAGAAHGAGALACDIAALLAERDGLSRETDLAHRLALLRGSGDSAARRWRAAARQLRHLAGVRDAERVGGDPGMLVALAYPDRIAQRRDAGTRYRLSGGGGAFLADSDPLAREPFLAVALTDGHPAEARIHLAAPLARASLEAAFGDRIEAHDLVQWDRHSEAVLARRERRLGALVLDAKPLANPNPAAVAAVFSEALAAQGLDALPWTPACRALQARVLFLRQALPEEDWPDLGDAALLNGLRDWLGPALSGMARRADLARLDLLALLRAQVSPALQRRLEAEAPARLALPAGGEAPIDYTADGGPTLRAKVQALFGLTGTPRLARGRVALRIELLSPAGRPAAITQDIAGFWKTGYRDVRAALRGRYPKHAWPEDPSQAPAPRPRPR